ncbi:hypothetical protein ACNKXS_13555 [Christiangramia marina]|uniref:hypothetical protein n=1 Tax=Christiangramia marina TaxID=409436 RepID=UPI003AA7D3F9
MEKLKSVINFSLIETKYFWIAIVVIGTIGIWLPFLLGSEVKLSELSILFTTYYISIYFSGCLDSVINKIKNLKRHDQNDDIIKRFLNVIGLILGAIGLVIATILLNKNGLYGWATFVALIGTMISLSLWWKNNWEDKTYDQRLRDKVNNNHGNNW